MTLEVGLVGEGERFAAILALLQANGTPFRVARHPGFKGKYPAKIEPVEVAELKDTPLVFVAVPMSGLRDVARTLGDALTGRHALVHSCHNVERGSLATASMVLREETPTRRLGFVTGPMRSEEVSKGLPAAGVCASAFPEVWELVESALVHPGFRLYRSEDLRGAEVAAAYARVIAMAAGVACEMKLGQSVMATLFARGLAEVARFVSAHGGHERTTFGLAGSANLQLDTTPPGSPDFRVGQAAMQSGKFDEKDIAKKFGTTGRDLLGLVESLYEGSRGTRTPTHILDACHKMVSGELDPQEVVVHLMTLPALDD